jgi:DNA-binding NarL/FixJ family response regulator
MKRRIVLVDVHDAVRELLCRYLERMPEYEVVGVAGTGLEAIRVLKTASPHRAIIGLLLPQLCAVTK